MRDAWVARAHPSMAVGVECVHDVVLDLLQLGHAHAFFAYLEGTGAVVDDAVHFWIQPTSKSQCKRLPCRCSLAHAWTEGSECGQTVDRKPSSSRLCRGQLFSLDLRSTVFLPVNIWPGVKALVMFLWVFFLGSTRTMPAEVLTH